LHNLTLINENFDDLKLQEMTTKITPMIAKYYTYTPTVHSTTFVSERFVKYLTTSWTKGSSYYWTESTTVSWGITGGLTKAFAEKVSAAIGVNASYTKTYGAGVNIPCESDKDSKLALYSDFTKKDITIVEKIYTDGWLTSEKSQRGVIDSPTKDSYLRPTYK